MLSLVITVVMVMEVMVDTVVIEEDMVIMERDLQRLLQDTMVLIDMVDMDMVMVMVEDMVTMERDLLRLSLVMDTEAMDMVDLEDIGVMEAMDTMVKGKS